ncbi:hypothetical protein KQ700_16260, partial [Listeria monocytogenes]|nr:hypothetical protein [Listeria monocytogenes]
VPGSRDSVAGDPPGGCAATGATVPGRRAGSPAPHCVAVRAQRAVPRLRLRARRRRPGPAGLSRWR